MDGILTEEISLTQKGKLENKRHFLAMIHVIEKIQHKACKEDSKKTKSLKVISILFKVTNVMVRSLDVVLQLLGAIYSFEWKVI